MTNHLERLKNERGVSLMELMLTLAVAAIVGGMAAATMTDSRRTMAGDGAMRLVMAELNGAREIAMTQRHLVEVQFIGGMWIKTIRHELANNQITVLHTVALEGNMQFSLVPNIPDTPDGFGNGTAVAFGQAQSIQFNGDGSLVDSGGTVVNGTVFMSFLQRLHSFRAVTILGSTGRVRAYKAGYTISPTTGAYVFTGWNRV
jgi:prepilin-type N-terminal cleavage/methylation domain-containing protein